ncbi:hypothetical protein LPB140_06460 [Sphingorhabdus lutea]|uniref:Glycosyltransferase n=1 Tax=Sphingorhabdus lutea TaxID=1913578 RepID=A0A1L3JBG4_9SPHN|nr:glycosyltransferase [Sphingorhabdus lutea]APG62487.1 hypothetical protein LPB140_06460 [Sphingorhabdus lutea]
MRIAQVDVNYGYSSTGKIVESLSKSLIFNEDEFLCLYGRGTNSNSEVVYKYGLDVETIIHAGMTRITGYDAIYSPFSTWRLINKLKKFKPDIVHLHDLHGYHLNIGRLIKFLTASDIPVVWSFHCEYQYTGKCGHAFDCEGWLNQCGNCPQINVYPKSFYLDKTDKMLKQKVSYFRSLKNPVITCPSEWLSDRVIQSHLSASNVQVVPNGINNSEYFVPQESNIRKELGIADDDFLILVIGSDIMSPAKGGKYIFELLPRIKNKKVKILVVGADQDEQAPNNQIIFLAKQKSQHDLAKIYTASNVTLLLSRRETFSMVCAESLSCGTPIIGFEAGAPEKVAPKPYGFFIEYGNLEALSKLVNSIMDKEVLLAGAKECAEFAIKNYSDIRMAENFKRIYEERLKLL